MLRWKRLFVFKRAVPSDSNRKYRLFDQGKNSFYQTFWKMSLSLISLKKVHLLAINKLHSALTKHFKS